MQQSTSPIQNVWKKWQKDKDQDAGNELVVQYMPLVDYHVNRISAHLPKNVSKQEIKSLGFIGLVDALEKFDSKRDLKFDTYASFRIRGAIIDGLRKEDWLPRTVRDRAKQIEVIAEKLEQELKREPTSSEIAEELGLTNKEVEETIKDSLFATPLSIEEKINDDDDRKDGIGYILPDEKARTPEHQLLQKEKMEDLAEAIKQLNDKEQLVISLFYQEELTLTEIGEVMELSTSRISQIHSRAVFKLKKVLSSL
ncbi:RNA polymerase sigma factor for flagellar operon FliA [Salirhabdus euzebyi]|uniref:RNA polymerase sigma factor for flagellar operon FliA n=1 Tax=Salirhabdus euzebyi TaxID=394506 RepID=A0A841Q3C8_9BACI|nr:FliA/WhiG family RNA polymerase sigma factor [Salirhabdus euzebyi]MBB6452899.1 RNA polymerase sigma factor for flagellar operon FliA [Salirhabdus euzebyi]